MTHSIHKTRKAANAVARELREQGERVKVLQHFQLLLEDGALRHAFTYEVRYIFS